jgi:hypothetical protein
VAEGTDIMRSQPRSSCGSNRPAKMHAGAKCAATLLEVWHMGTSSALMLQHPQAWTASPISIYLHKLFREWEDSVVISLRAWVVQAQNIRRGFQP